MEQTTQQNIQKPSLPIKTKIAAWWMITLGVVGGVCSVYLTKYFIRTLPYLNDSLIDFLIVCFLSSLFVFFSGLILFTKKRWAWWLSIVMFVILMIIELLTEFSDSIELFTKFSASEWVLIILLVVPLALLLLDRKNFWEVSQETFFPIGTRIIGILMLLIGGAGLIYSIYLFYQSNNVGSHEEAWLFGAVVSIVFGIIFFFSGLLILRKKKLGWWLAIIIFSIITAIVFFAVNVMYIHFLFNLIISLISLIPLIILLRDRKNFFKIAS